MKSWTEACKYVRPEVNNIKHWLNHAQFRETVPSKVVKKLENTFDYRKSPFSFYDCNQVCDGQFTQHTRSIIEPLFAHLRHPEFLCIKNSTQRNVTIKS